MFMVMGKRDKEGSRRRRQREEKKEETGKNTSIEQEEISVSEIFAKKDQCFLSVSVCLKNSRKS